MQPTCVLEQDTEMHVAEGEGVLRQPAHGKRREGKGRKATEGATLQRDHACCVRNSGEMQIPNRLQTERGWMGKWW